LKLIVTGSSCVGKSAIVRKLAAELDLKVFDVDAWTADQYKFNPSFIAFLNKTFGSTDKSVVKAKLAENSFLIHSIESEMKPHFEVAMKHFLDTHNSGIIDMAQLFETQNVKERFGEMIIVNVTASREDRLKMAEKRGVSRDTLEFFDKNQYSPEMKSVLSDITITNQFDGDCEDVTALIKIIKQVRECASLYAKVRWPESWETPRPEELDGFKYLTFMAALAYHLNGMHHHTFDHVLFMLKKFVALKEPQIHACYGVYLFVAIMMHDVVYVPGSTTNEEKSAVVANMLIAKYLPTFPKNTMVAELIISTKQLPSTGFRSNTSQTLINIIHDLDYAIFAAPIAEVQRYDQNIYKEGISIYATRKEYFTARIDFLYSLTALKSIFRMIDTDGSAQRRAVRNIRMLLNLNLHQVELIDDEEEGFFGDLH
jgi:predicted metal-dependent HD superfamily phosphohydrolase/dephospho-CoA kinase